jgi:outer membrane protein assembly factor BamB
MVWCDTMRATLRFDVLSGRGIIPQRIVARPTPSRILLVLVAAGLGACPYLAEAAQGPVSPGVRLLPAEEAWAATLPAPPSAQGAIDGERVYIPLEIGRVVALSRGTGTTEWSVPLESLWPALAQDGHLLVVSGATLVSLAPNTGSRRWTTALDGEVIAPLVQDGDRVFAVTEWGLTALRRTDGERLWATPIASLPGTAHISVGTGTLSISQGPRVVTIDLDSGGLRWERELPGTLGPPVATADRLFVGSTDNALYALEIETGRIAWRWRYGGDVVGAAAGRGRVYVAALDNVLRSVHSSSGNQIWKQGLATRPVLPPIVTGGTILLAGNDPALTAFDAETGALLATYEAPADLQGAPLVDSTPDSGRVAIVVITRDGRAVALRPRAAPVPGAPAER